MEKSYAKHRIERWAKVIQIIAGVFLLLTIAAGIIILALDEDFWWISLIIVGAGGLSMIPLLITVDLFMGFAEIIGNTQVMAFNSAATHYDIGYTGGAPVSATSYAGAKRTSTAASVSGANLPEL